MRYRRLLKIAHGGMATVHVGAVEGGLGFRQFVAIKEPHRHLLDDRSYPVLLQEEARLGALLRHANVVSIRDVVLHDDGGVWLVMDYVEGVDLGQLVDEGRSASRALPPSAVIQIVLDAAEGLAAVHQLSDEKGRHLGLIHRDISPQNLLIGRDGVTRVADFGVAKFRRSEGRSTTAGKLRGKVAYMAPEYLQGQPFDARLDVFALGVVLWEGLSGTRLFRGDSEGETLLRVLSQEAPALHALRPELPAALDDVLAAALAKEPVERFASARAFAAALASATRGTPFEGSRVDVRRTVEELAGRQLEDRQAELRRFFEEEPSVASLRGPVRSQTPTTASGETDATSRTQATAPQETASPLEPRLVTASPDTSAEPQRGAPPLLAVIGLLALLAVTLGAVAGALVRPRTVPSAAAATSGQALVADGGADPLPAPTGLLLSGGPGDRGASVAVPSAPKLPTSSARAGSAPGVAKKPPPNPYGGP